MSRLSNERIEMPIRDKLDYKFIKKPYLMYALMVTLLITFCIQIFYIKDNFWDYCMYWNGVLTGEWWRCITHIFLHAPNMWYWFIPIHIASNLYYLYIFGDNVEDWFGRNKYLRFGFIPFFLICGIVAGIVFGISQPESFGLGASGAISGLMGFYFIMYPYAQIDMLSLKVIPVTKWEDLEEIWKSKVIYTVSAYYYLFAWFGVQFVGWYYLTGEPIAYLAHVSGFLFGVGSAILCKRLTGEKISSEFLSKLKDSIKELIGKIGIGNK